MASRNSTGRIQGLRTLATIWNTSHISQWESVSGGSNIRYVLSTWYSRAVSAPALATLTPADPQAGSAASLLPPAPSGTARPGDDWPPATPDLVGTARFRMALGCTNCPRCTV